MQLVPVTNPFLAREFGTSIAARDIESAAKFIGAGAATVGAAGIFLNLLRYINLDEFFIKIDIDAFEFLSFLMVYIA